MTGSWATDRFPQLEPALNRLVGQHLELKEEPLHLAIAYRPADRDPQDVFLFEVVTMLSNGLNPEHDLFEVAFLATPEFPIPGAEAVHLVLTNPREWEFALQHRWARAIELVHAIRAGDYQVLHRDATGAQALDKLRAEFQVQEAARG